VGSLVLSLSLLVIDINLLELLCSHATSMYLVYRLNLSLPSILYLSNPSHDHHDHHHQQMKADTYFPFLSQILGLFTQLIVISIKFDINQGPSTNGGSSSATTTSSTGNSSNAATWLRYN